MKGQMSNPYPKPSKCAQEILRPKNIAPPSWDTEALFTSGLYPLLENGKKKKITSVVISQKGLRYVRLAALVNTSPSPSPRIQSSSELVEMSSH